MFPPTLGRVRATARAQLLAESLERQLGFRVMVRVAKSYAELEEKVLSASVDVAWAPPSICARSEEKELTILKTVRQGRSMYRSALVCRKSDKLSVDSLCNLRAAWVDPLSTGGRLLALSLLRQQGLSVDQAFSQQAYHGSYQGALLALLRNQADISSIYVYGSEEKDVRNSLSEHIGASEVQLCGFAFTDETPSDGVIDTGNSAAARELFELLLSNTPSRPRSLLLELVEAEDLELAQKTDYWAVRQALVQL